MGRHRSLAGRLVDRFPPNLSGGLVSHPGGDGECFRFVLGAAAAEAVAAVARNGRIFGIILAVKIG